MKKYSKTESGAHGSAVRTNQTFLGKIGEKETIDDVVKKCAWFGWDFAIEYTGANVHIYRVRSVGGIHG